MSAQSIPLQGGKAMLQRHHMPQWSSRTGTVVPASRRSSDHVPAVQRHQHAKKGRQRSCTSCTHPGSWSCSVHRFMPRDCSACTGSRCWPARAASSAKLCIDVQRSSPVVPVQGPQVGAGPARNLQGETPLHQVVLEVAAVGDGHGQLLQGRDEVGRVVLTPALPAAHLPWQGIQHPHLHGEVCGH